MKKAQQTPIFIGFFGLFHFVCFSFFCFYFSNIKKTKTKNAIFFSKTSFWHPQNFAKTLVWHNVTLFVFSKMPPKHYKNGGNSAYIYLSIYIYIYSAISSSLSLCSWERCLVDTSVWPVLSLTCRFKCQSLRLCSICSRGTPSCASYLRHSAVYLLHLVVKVSWGMRESRGQKQKVSWQEAKGSWHPATQLEWDCKFGCDSLVGVPLLAVSLPPTEWQETFVATKWDM